MSAKRLVTGTLLAAGWWGAWPALAASGEGSGEIGLWVILFLAFGAVIITFQFIPALVLFASMVAALFRRGVTKSALGEKAEKRV